MYNYRVYNNLFWIFLIQMKYRLQSMYNHMVGRAASVVSPFYSILLVFYWTVKLLYKPDHSTLHIIYTYNIYMLFSTLINILDV